MVPPYKNNVHFQPEPSAFPPRFEAPGEFAILAARSFDIPFSFRATYCFRFLTAPPRCPGMALPSFPSKPRRKGSINRGTKAAGSARRVLNAFLNVVQRVLQITNHLLPLPSSL